MSRLERHARSAGFTLIEVVLALGLASGVLLGTLTFYDTTTRLRTTVRDKVSAVSDIRLLMQTMTNEIECMFIDHALGQRLNGNSEYMQFMTTAVPSEAAWERTDTGSSFAPQSGTRRIEYRVRKVEREVEIEREVDGQLRKERHRRHFVEGIERGELLFINTINRGGKTDRFLVAPAVRFVRFRYSDGHHWHDHWPHHHLPRGVEISLGLDPLEDGRHANDYRGEVFRRVVAVHRENTASPRPVRREDRQ